MVKVSLFGLAGTGTSSVGRQFAKKNNFIFKSSGDMFREVAARHNLTVTEFNIKCQEDPSVDKKLDDEIIEFGKTNDNFIFDSRLAWFTIPDSVKVKLICEEKERVRRIVERDGGEASEVRVKTLTREKSELKRYYDYYDIEDYTLDNHFDLIIDSTNISIEEVSKKIEEYLENKHLF